MDRRPDFDDIRPYYEDELPDAMRRISKSESFPLLASYVYPDEDVKIVKEKIRSFKTFADFQLETMRQVNAQIIKRSITEFSCHGLEQLDKQKQYLYVSNHRDIMLDASLLQYALTDNGFETTEITFGANLMSSPLIIDIGKSNKMFRVERPGGGAKEFYKSSLHLSEYIRYALLEKKQSVWIAQRNGRTKNGIDATDQGIIKMFGMSRTDDKIKSLAELNIVPMSISYEWESCDILKTLELYQSKFGKYVKKPGEDLNSILTGIIQPKGNVHIEIARPITIEDLLPFENMPNNEYNKTVAKLLDSRIVSAYRLFPNNYIAHDLRFGNFHFSENYTKGLNETFLKYLEKIEQYDNCDVDQLKDIFLGIYSNPVDSKINLK